MTIFPRLLNSGNVRCCSKGLDDCFAAHRTVKEKTKLPVAVGFGISKPSHVNELKKFADGAVIGSAIIDVIMESKKNESKKNDSVDRVIDFISKLSK